MENETAIPAIILFDLDGVLIQPGGYRAAVKKTVNYFSQKLGLGDQIPKEEDLAFFEANGVTSEWDMVPICAAILVDLASRAGGTDFTGCSLDDVGRLIREKGIKIRADYRAEIERIIPFLNRAEVPAAENLLTAVQAGNVFEGRSSAPYLTELLGDTRHVERSETLRVFQSMILGDEGFAAAYGFQAGFESESYLKKYDKSSLTLENQKRLQHVISNGTIKAAVITARPSLAPDGMRDVANDYSPEAEMAVGLTGLRGIPLVGYGTLQFLAGRIGAMADSLVKPSPVQALAAIAAACGEEMVSALDWAAEMAQGGRNQIVNGKIPARFTLHIFEDSAIGIRACQRAVVILKQVQIEATVKAWGIARNLDKIKTLESVGAKVFPDVNLALEEALL